MSTATTPDVDVVTAEVVRNGLVAAAREMSTTLERSAYNPLLFELKDYSVVITDAGGRLWAEAPGLIGFLRAMPDLVQHGLAKHAGRLEPGDVLIANDPFTTGTHISDTTTYMPIFVDGELVAVSAATAHWADIGGKTPGGWCPDSIDVFQEGIRLSHVKLLRGGAWDETLLEVLLANVRLPDTVRGDLEAQVAACRTGAERVQALCARHGVATVSSSMRWACDASERALRARVAELPDGEYTAETYMDHDGNDKATRRLVRLRIRIDGDRVTADLTGSCATVGGPINLPLSGTIGAVNAGLKSVLAPREPANDGEFRVVDVIAQPDTIVNPSPPAPCDSYGYVFTAIVELTLRALSGIAPERCPAGTGQMFGIYLFRVDRRGGEPFIMIDATTVGWGARPDGDGPNLIFVIDGDTPNVPAEIIEGRYPVLMTRHELNPGSGGAGRFRGGLGVVREFEVLEDWVSVQAFMENQLAPPEGVGGGQPAEVHAVVLRPGSEAEEVFRERFAFGGPLHRGERIRAIGGGGGGWGDPLDRDPTRVREDVLDEFVGLDEAAALYGVVVREEGGDVVVDEEATRSLRASRRT